MTIKVHDDVSWINTAEFTDEKVYCSRFKYHLCGHILCQLFLLSIYSCELPPLSGIMNVCVCVLNRTNFCLLEKMCYSELKPQDVCSSFLITSCVISGPFLHLAVPPFAFLVTPSSCCGVSWGLNDINLAQPSSNWLSSPHSFFFVSNIQPSKKDSFFSLREAFNLFFNRRMEFGFENDGCADCIISHQLLRCA